ncbi:MAG: hypothetical protein HUK14_01405 [Muribaculaceae bacterium]|nr:hypothetical protein [Muribaculaceae bacterium]
MNNALYILRSVLLAACCLLVGTTAYAQRRITPVNNEKPGKAQTTTPLAAIPSQTAPVQVADTLATDTLATDTLILKKPPVAPVEADSVAADSLKAEKKGMKCPLFHNVSIGVNIWDGLMRIFGQDNGVGDIWATLSFHNRYLIFASFGFGMCKSSPDTGAYTYRSPLAPVFKIGFEYNCLFNQNPDYCLLVGARYGYTPFKFSVDDISLEDTYWSEKSQFSIPTQSVSAGFAEVSVGIRVKIVKNLSMGWNFMYRILLHESGNAEYGKPIYIPGFGKREGSFCGAFSIIYNIPLHKS